MVNNGKRKIRRTKKQRIFPQFCVVTVLCVLLSSGIAYGWQSIEDKINENEEQPFSPSEQSSLEALKEKNDNLGQQDESSVKADEQSSKENSETQGTENPSSQETESSEEASEENKYGLVSKTERVRSNYFDDAAFIGDSITTGILLYDIMPNADVIASTGINLQSIMTAEVIKSKDSDRKLTVLEALDKAEANKIYIMLGANGLAYLGAEQTVKYYDSFIEEVKKVKPDAIIYVQSIFPIHESLFAQNYKGNLTNGTIDATNELLMKMCEEKEIYYLNPGEVFKDETGGLMREVTADGLHFNSEYYTKWMDYLKVHAITEK